MEIIEFIYDCIQAVLHWRITLPVIVGLMLGFIALAALGTTFLGFTVGGSILLGFSIMGYRWHAAYERRFGPY